jgi:hypothetical protein
VLLLLLRWQHAAMNAHMRVREDIVSDTLALVSAVQNFYASIPGIRKGMLYYPLGEGALLHVDMEDVGKVSFVRNCTRCSWPTAGPFLTHARTFTDVAFSF